MLAVAVLLSGAAALTYEVVWSRLLVVLLGNGTDATTAVLCVFMAGGGVGAYLAGRLADQVARPVRIYAIAEIALALFAVVFPWVVGPLETAFAFAGTFSHPAAAVGFRFGFAAALVFVPAALMGASVPVLVRAVVRDAAGAGRATAVLYGINTLGGAIGALFAGYYAVAHWGMAATSTVAAAAGACASLLALAAGRRATGTGRTGDEQPHAGATALSGAARWGVVVAVVCGFVVLGAEVVWARLLTLVFGHDTYAFSTLLAWVLVALAAGGSAYRLVARRNAETVMVASVALLAAALAGCYWVFGAVFVHRGSDPFGLDNLTGALASLRLELWKEVVFTPVLVALPAFFSALALPAAVAVATRGAVGRAVGTVLLGNQLACAAGAVIAALVAVPAVGVGNTVRVLAAAAVLVVLAWSAVRGRRWWAWILVTASAALVVAAPADLPRRMLHEAVGPRHQRIVHYEEGRTATVSVTVNTINKERQLFVNAVNEVTTRVVHDQSFKLLGHLGMLLHPDPQDVFMICFGAGLSAGAAVAHPLSRLDVVDLSDAVFRAADHFSAINHDVLSDPRVHVHVDDGRQYLLRTDRRYDVMIVDSTHPKAQDSWLLYTKEFYVIARSHLRDDGILVQWVPLHGLSETEFASIVRTFASVFPHGTLWLSVGYEVYGQAAYAKLVGTKAPLSIDYRELAARLREPKVAADLRRWGMDDPLEILDSYVGDVRHMARWLDRAPIQTDDRPLLPYITAATEGRRMAPEALLPFRSAPWDKLHRMGDDEPALRARWQQVFDATGLVMARNLERALQLRPDGKKLRLSQRRFATAAQYYAALAALYADDPRRLAEVGNYLGNLGFSKRAAVLLGRAVHENPRSVRARINWALAVRDAGDTQRALRILQRLHTERPEDPLVSYNLAVVLLQTGDAAGAVLLLRDALARAPWMQDAQVALGNAYRLAGDLDAARRWLSALAKRLPHREDVHATLALVALQQGRTDEALRRMAKAVALHPYQPDIHYNMGLVLAKMGRLDTAVQAFSTALYLRPDDAEVLDDMGLALGGMGRIDDAITAHLKALEIDPSFAKAAYNLGLAYRAKGDVAKAAWAFRSAARIDPDLRAALEQLAALKGAAQPEAVTPAVPEESSTDGETPDPR